MKATMDSSTPANLSSQGIFLTAEWRHLMMLNYEVDPGSLHKFVPAGTELDLWNGKAFISLVGFRFLDTKILGIPIPFHRNFEEVNLRFYVLRREQDEVKRGVVFIREIVPRRAIATVARAFYNENYIALPMSHQIRSVADNSLVVDYAWRLGTLWSKMSLNVKGDPAPAKPNSEEQFITDHYWGYTARRDGGCSEYRVAHPPWKVWTGENAVVEGNLEELYGVEIATVLKNHQASVFLAEGSEVTVSRGRKL
jgi:uncharacterized protein YqjF (DUF2071 family)